MIQVRDLTLRFGERLLFDSISMLFPDASRAGLVGKNGAGKTTFLRVLARQMEPDEGTVEIPQRQSLGYLPQDVAELGTEKVLHYLKSRSGILEMEEQLQSLEESISIASEDSLRQGLLKSYEHLRARYDAKGGYTFRPRAEKILRGLGFPEDASERSCTTFSGGWKMRIALTSLLLQEPDILLLDEPTNHLDTESMEWLESYLKDYRGTFIAVSHDRRFLDKMTTRTLEIARGQLREYKGNYSYYLEQKEEDKRLFEKRAKQQQALRKQTEDFIERFRYKASKASQVQSRIKMLEREDILMGETEGASVHFSFPECPRSGHEVLSVQDVNKYYGTKKVFENLSFSVARGERVALVGVNGAGKSTLCRLLSRKEGPSSGSISFGHKVLCGFFSQESIDNLHYQNTVWQEVLAEGDYFSPQYKRNLLGAFLFSGEDIEKPVSVLSGGEKTRLALLKMLLRETNLLILDEPTNHLDMQTKELFQKALLAYSGTLIIVSHDRYFLDTLVERVVELYQGRGREYLGNYSYFIEKREALLEEQKEEAQERPSGETPEDLLSSSGYKSREQKRREAELRQILSEKRRTVTAHLAPLEKEIEGLETRKAALEEALCSPGVLEDPEKRTAHLKEHGEIEQLLPQKLEEWEDLMEKLHAIEEEFALS